MKDFRNLGLRSELIISVLPNSTASPEISLNMATRMCISSKALGGGRETKERVSSKLEICYLFLMAKAILAASITSTLTSFSWLRICFQSLFSTYFHKYFQKFICY